MNSNTIRIWNVLATSLASFFAGIMIALVVILTPGLAEATGAFSTNLLTPYVFIEGLRHLIVAAIGLMWLRAKGGMPTTGAAVAHACLYALCTSLLFMGLQLLTLRGTSWPMLVEALVLLAVSLLATVIVRPRRARRL